MKIHDTEKEQEETIPVTREMLGKAEALLADKDLQSDLAEVESKLREAYSVDDILATIHSGDLELNLTDYVRLLRGVPLTEDSKTLLLDMSLSYKYDSEAREEARAILTQQHPELGTFVCATVVQEADGFMARIALDELRAIDQPSAQRLAWELGEQSGNAPMTTDVVEYSRRAAHLIDDINLTGAELREGIIDLSMINADFGMALYAVQIGSAHPERRVLGLDGLSGLNLTSTLAYAKGLRGLDDVSGVKARQLLDSFQDLT